MKKSVIGNGIIKKALAVALAMTTLFAFTGCGATAAAK